MPLPFPETPPTGSPSLLMATAGELDKAAAAASLVPVMTGQPEILPATAPVAPGQKPPFLPDDCWDATTGSLRPDALLEAYARLVTRLQTMVSIPGPEASIEEICAFHRARGVPETPEEYRINAPHPLLAPDLQLNGILHGAGFTPDQAQLVYDLAAERVLPVIEDLAADFEADRQLVRLIDHFGGEERWTAVSRQILAWGKGNLPPDVLNALSTTYEGILTLYRMMGNNEPSLRPGNTAPAAGPMNEGEIKALMRDPRYWRDRDPAVMRQVSDGFRRLYGQG